MIILHKKSNNQRKKMKKSILIVKIISSFPKMQDKKDSQNKCYKTLMKIKKNLKSLIILNMKKRKKLLENAKYAKN